MRENEPTEIQKGAHEAGGGFGRAVKGAVIVFVLLMIAIALMSWLGGDSSTLPLDYDGFD